MGNNGKALEVKRTYKLMAEPLYTIAECYNDINFWNQRYNYNEVIKEYQMVYREYMNHQRLEQKQLHQYLKASNDVYSEF
jgi:hypothetical protein